MLTYNLYNMLLPFDLLDKLMRIEQHCPFTYLILFQNIWLSTPAFRKCFICFHIKHVSACSMWQSLYLSRHYLLPTYPFKLSTFSVILLCLFLVFSNDLFTPALLLKCLILSEQATHFSSRFCAVPYLFFLSTYLL